SAALGWSCEDCHGTSDTKWEDYALDSSPKKATARRMVTMMSSINQTSFGGRQVVTCYTCHRGSNRPRVTPRLALLYGATTLAAPRGPGPALARPAGELHGVKLDAEWSCRSRIKETLSGWRVGVPAELDDRTMQVVQGSRPGGALATFYFDSQSGLLVRLVRY